MKILVTGANGFIGKNLITEISSQYNNYELLLFTRDNSKNELEEMCKKADFVFHLAGVNRPINEEEFKVGNYQLTKDIVEALRKTKNNCPIMYSSTIHAESDNLYGISKKAAEELIFDYSSKTGAKALVYQFPNVFGKWCKPNYNSVIATFCHNISREMPITVHNPNVQIKLVYIDDVINELIKALNGEETRVGKYCYVPKTYKKELKEIVQLLNNFKATRSNYSVPKMSDPFTKKLYSTYLSYLPESDFRYELKMNIDERGSFTEFLKTPDRGQVSVNISKPGVVKGNHWHHTKNEKFLVVSGKGVIRFRNLNSKNEIIEYLVSGEKLEVVDIPPGYTHNIENLGDSDMVTIMWANENYNPGQPDTKFLEV